ncbi:hypothetical protein L873DRAFT_1796415 [Choiromyces venosus 120613-1]|uniref:Uncharacterized protein n=1 Tax=Choiromyces venosus 120613-1 TaxID=1336337 RepID=A0A3N4ISK1_9PEZI|nr:hypothetical protein L873DRAFT_1796415 [Choiromyces venosus 120613-1]
MAIDAVLTVPVVPSSSYTAPRMTQVVLAQVTSTPPVQPVAPVPACPVYGPSTTPLTLRTSNIAPVAPVSSSSSPVAATSSDDKLFTVVSSQKGRCSAPWPGPTVTAHKHHVAIHFKKRGTKTLLPAGINMEMIKNTLNTVFVAQGSDAHFGSHTTHRTTVDLFLDLVQHSAASIWDIVPHLEVTAMGLGLNGFSFCQDTKKVKILISQLPLSSAGVRSSWGVSDWQGDAAFDDMIRDLEVTNPGFNIVGRPHWIGSLAGHKQYKHN